jgi:DAK2 domain fusion protein YloV
VYAVPQSREGHEGPLEPARALVGAALAALEASRERIDDLNVYPVPDGDTGTNMTLTVRAVRDALTGSTAATREDVAREISRASLMGARGNSGVILSQLVRGATEAVAEDAPIDTVALARALRAASDAGYAAVREPQEGTILTIARELAERSEALATGDPPLGEALGELVEHGEQALARTTEQLPTLRDAGVVDAGGAGLLELVRGIAAYVRGEPVPDPPAYEAALPDDALHLELSRFRYCTSFFVEGDNVDPDTLERDLGELGDSLLVVGSRGAVKIHVHTDEPGRALALGTAVGIVGDVDVKNMHAQIVDREDRLSAEPRETARSAVVAVCAGDGNAKLFRSLGAGVVEGGQTMNPPTSELLAALESAAADEVVLLPNNKNVLLAAEQAAAASSRPAIVVPTETMQAGLAALLAFDPSRPASENAKEMTEAAGRVRAGAVTRASRSATVDGVAVAEGEYLGLVDGHAVAAGADLDSVADEIVARLLAEPADVLTILVGDHDPDLTRLRERIEAAHPDIEVEVANGGQPHYPLLFGAE